MSSSISTPFRPYPKSSPNSGAFGSNQIQRPFRNKGSLHSERECSLGEQFDKCSTIHVKQVETASALG